MAFQNNDMSSMDILHAQAHIWSHIYSFVNSMSLKCAVELQIPDIIHRHGAPMLISELVEALPIHKDRSPYIYRLMRVLVHSGFFLKQNLSSAEKAGLDDEEEREGYLLAPTSRFLLKEEPLSIRPFLLSVLNPIQMDPWQHMSEWFQNNDITPFHTTNGSSFWNLAAQEPSHNQLFNEAMTSDARLVTSVLLKHSADTFKGLSSLVDVGGGTGTVAEALAKAFPKLSCICFDLPHVVNGLEGNKNLSYVGGDMFESVPKAEAVLLKSILHDWNDKECIRILTRCKEAIPNNEKGGKLIIIDMVVKTQDETNELLKTQLLIDMQMMALVSGRERSEKDWAKLLLDAGFSRYKITPILGLRSLIEAYP